MAKSGNFAQLTKCTHAEEKESVDKERAASLKINPFQMCRISSEWMWIRVHLLILRFCITKYLFVLLWISLVFEMLSHTYTHTLSLFLCIFSLSFNWEYMSLCFSICTISTCLRIFVGKNEKKCVFVYVSLLNHHQRHHCGWWCCCCCRRRRRHRHYHDRVVVDAFYCT